MTILVTGCAGLFGANFSRFLLSKNHKVVGIDNLTCGYDDFVPKDHRFTFVKSSIYDDDRLDDLFQKHGITHVYHFAALAAAGLSPFIREKCYQNNIMASARLINASVRSGVKKFVFTSSMEVYGAQRPPFREEDVDGAPQETPYGISKRATEQDLEIANRFHGLDYSIIRPHNVHGVYQNIWDRYRNVLGIFIRQAIAGENLTIYGDGAQMRAFSDIRYYMEPLYKLMTEGSRQTYNIGADKPTTVNQLAEMVQLEARLHGSAVDVIHMEARTEVPWAWCDHTKAKEELGFVDSTNLEELVSKMYNWAIRQPVKPSQVDTLELKAGVYEYWK